jgi:hypothetical protein
MRDHVTDAFKGIRRDDEGILYNHIFLHLKSSITRKWERAHMDPIQWFMPLGCPTFPGLIQ